MRAPVAIRPDACAALGVLAHLYLRFSRPADAATLLAALVRIDPNPAWAQRTRCLALLRANQPGQALAELRPLLDGTLDDPARAGLLLVAAQASWRLGQADDARTYLAASRALFTVSVVPQSSSPAPARAPRRRR